VIAAAPPVPTPRTEEPKIFLVAAEESGDRLGAALMHALRERAAVPPRFFGLGGRDMTAAGLTSLLPIDDFSIIGVASIPRRLPLILHHIYRTVRAIVSMRPQALVLIDSPDFTQWIAKFVRRLDPSIPIVQYVSPSVWAWRPGRARSMRGVVDHVLALLPFEPEVHRKLGGPPCSYVGHPLIEQVDKLRPSATEAQRRRADPPIVLAMPGSRSSEVRLHADVFGEALALLQRRVGPIEVVIPTAPHLLPLVKRVTAGWEIRPRIVADPAEKQAAMRSARVALAKSGTTTLELAVAGIPTVAAYRVSPIEALIAVGMVRVPTFILANLVIGESVVPEVFQWACTGARLAEVLVPLMSDTPERKRQMDAFARLDAIMEVGAQPPASRAANIVLDLMKQHSAAAGGR